MALTNAAALIASNRVVIFSMNGCPYCVKVKKLLNGLSKEVSSYELDTGADGARVHAEIVKATGHETFPAVYIAGQFIGGCDDTVALQQSGQLDKLLAAPKE